MTILQFVKCMKYLCNCYSSDMDDTQIKVWYKFFQDVSYNTLLTAIKEIVLESKFFPNVPTLKQKCIQVNRSYIFKIVNFMKEDGYFIKGSFGNLSEKHELRSYDKTLMWLEDGTIPDFLKEDIKLYMNMYENKIEKKDLKQLGNV